MEGGGFVAGVSGGRLVHVTWISARSRCRPEGAACALGCPMSMTTLTCGRAFPSLGMQANLRVPVHSKEASVLFLPGRG